ncbi:MAG: hypothetical protein WCG83_04875 [Candidatus Peregrinibacteria bacterium]
MYIDEPRLEREIAQTKKKCSENPKFKEIGPAFSLGSPLRGIAAECGKGVDTVNANIQRLVELLGTRGNLALLSALLLSDDIICHPRYKAVIDTNGIHQKTTLNASEEEALYRLAEGSHVNILTRTIKKPKQKSLQSRIRPILYKDEFLTLFQKLGLMINDTRLNVEKSRLATTMAILKGIIPTRDAWRIVIEKMYGEIEDEKKDENQKKAWQVFQRSLGEETYPAYLERICKGTRAKWSDREHNVRAGRAENLQEAIEKYEQWTTPHISGCSEDEGATDPNI